MLRELRLLLACAWDKALDIRDALQLQCRRAWCGVFGHGRLVQRLACVTCGRCGAVVAHLPLGVVQAVRKDGTFVVRAPPGVAEELSERSASALSVGFRKKDGGG